MHTDYFLTYIKCVQERGSSNKSQEDTQPSSGNFESVKEYIKENILETSNAISMNIWFACFNEYMAALHRI